jgi:hypothetical protein
MYHMHAEMMIIFFFLTNFIETKRKDQKKFTLKDSFLSTIVRVQLFEFYKHEMRPMAKMTLLNESIYPLDHVKCYHVTYNHQPTSQHLRCQTTWGFKSKTLEGVEGGAS